MSATESAMFAAGCFWGVEYKLGRLHGVLKTEVGYAGGHVADPDYKLVCTDTTGHAEVVRLEFDPDVIAYETLVREFFALHDPTQRNRQGPDVGSQYRSVIFCANDAQRRIAERVMRELDETEYGGRIVTEVRPDAHFWRAEEYHQKYIEKRGGHGCAL